MPPTSSPDSPPDPPDLGPRTGTRPSPGRRSRRKAGTALFLLAPVVLAATIGWSLQDDDAAPQDERTSSLAALRTALPLHRLLNSSTETARQVHRAEQALIAGCMARQGFAYERVPDPAPAGSETAGTAKSYFGIESVDSKASSAEEGAAPGRQPVERNRGQAFDRALYGDPERRISARNKVIRVTRPATGCLAEAQTRLLGEDGRQRDLTLRLVLDQGERDAVERLADDAAFRAADTDWLTCMADAGIEASNPRDFAQDLPRDTDLADDPSVAADLTCKKRTRYLERAYGRLAAVQQDWLSRHEKDAAEWRSLRTHEAGKADEVLRGAGHAAAEAAQPK
ncbi:hypothetical protein [Streptomyces chromofuscus]|uniref:Uncharacterized protein n=1 Tax=Streptomyces chromofuscus TaxID=42881 RepID=A0A7M2T7X6_STRCW|nr:hypothetical protein [Streptomyces chromofuscus]QOV44830.1 hypothetical protein IPT68_02085 [Streptomyces chromofuscus]GGS99882.1 hypothetical protein GCM10010254_19880 [Streptomyces chromofuscus]